MNQFSLYDTLCNTVILRVIPRMILRMKHFTFIRLITVSEPQPPSNDSLVPEVTKLKLMLAEKDQKIESLERRIQVY